MISYVLNVDLSPAVHEQFDHVSFCFSTSNMEGGILVGVLHGKNLVLFVSQQELLSNGKVPRFNRAK